MTPYETWLHEIRKRGLVPKTGRRGILADSVEPRIYLFEDEATAHDGLENWLLDEFPDVRWFAMVEVEVPDEWIQADPELAGSFYVTQAVPPAGLRLIRKIDGGEPT
jgi:hypothetical protein